MQNLADALQQIRKDLDETAKYYLEQHARLQEEAKSAAGSAKGEKRKEARKDLAALQERQKTWEETFQRFRDGLDKASTSP